jgi:2-dehydro-3-deoxyphosphogluconate aldolase/(4S)-4-hydroxy-2-oxoglutarate aldolase
MQARELLAGIRIVPVVVIDEIETAAPLAETFLEAGIKAIEITLRTEAGLDAIHAVAERVPDMLVGAGSLRTPDQVEDVKAAGARFGVSPGSTPTLVRAARDADLPFVPGAVTASEMLTLFEQGVLLQKFFPAELAGGAAYLKAVGAPLREVTFMPTGGIGPDNVGSYLSLPNVSCIGGSWLAPGDLLAARDFDGIRALARDAARLAV